MAESPGSGDKDLGSVCCWGSTRGGFDQYLSGEDSVIVTAENEGNIPSRKGSSSSVTHLCIYFQKSPLLLRRSPSSATKPHSLLQRKIIQMNSALASTGISIMPSWFLLPGASLLIVSFNLPWSCALASQ